MTIDQAFQRWVDENPFSPARITYWDEYCDLRDGLPLGTTNTKKNFRGQSLDWIDSERRLVKEESLAVTM